MPNPLDEARQIISVDDAIIALGLAEANYVEVERLVNAASRRIEKYCRTIFKKRRLTITLSGRNSPLLDLGAPIIAIYSVTVDGSALGVADYKVLKERGQLYREISWYSFDPLTGFTAGINNIVVDADFGYDPVPEDVQEACLLLIRRWMAATSGTVSDSSAFQSEHIGDYSYAKPVGGGIITTTLLGSLAPDLPAEVSGLLEQYVRWAIA